MNRRWLSSICFFATVPLFAGNADSRSRHCSHRLSERSSQYANSQTERGGTTSPSPNARPDIPARRLQDIQVLNILTYNLHNLDMEGGNSSTAPPPYQQRREHRFTAEHFLDAHGKIILEEKTDIGILEEVEAGGTLERFNQNHTDGLFRTLLSQGTDIQGIQVGMVVRKDLPFEIEYRSHRNRLWDNPISGWRRRVFTRDVPALILRVKGKKKPLLIVLGSHLKARHYVEGDPESNILRAGEVDASTAIIQELWVEFGEKIPVVFGGDLNGDFNKEAEYASLKSVALEDPFNLLKPAVAYQDRVTHSNHPRDGNAEWDQFDFLLVSAEIKGCVKNTYVHRYRDARGRVIPIPTTFADRKKNPSDHFPVILQLDMKCLLEIWGRK